MSCIRAHRQCERQFTDPFVTHLNETEATSFVPNACLDRQIRNSPQPEALYEDRSAGTSLVVERKRVVWPRDYPERHRTYHHVAEALFAETRLLDLAGDLPLSIELRLTHVPRRQRAALVGEVVRSVESTVGTLRAGRRVHFASRGARWSLYLDHGRFELDEPATGLGVRWNEDPSRPEQDLPGVVLTLQQLFAKTTPKFLAWPHSRRILLLEAHGSIVDYGDGWWFGVVAAATIPTEIDEVWLADVDSEPWVFVRVHPPQPGLAAAK